MFLLAPLSVCLLALLSVCLLALLSVCLLELLSVCLLELLSVCLLALLFVHPGHRQEPGREQNEGTFLFDVGMNAPLISQKS